MSETRFASIDWEIVWGLRLVVSGFLLLAVVVVGSVGGGSLVSMYARVMLSFPWSRPTPTSRPEVRALRNVEVSSTGCSARRAARAPRERALFVS